ncbi:hypothetical protein L9F63_010900 [Diploptera punctata]|uniref:RAP domain-containing protein n=1 Tax=Diploptera punctata TaxID=6984 RepID=A0AAD8EQ12_DIPPU|nr:hypothetical protein L9F63_010900 [Diploptera punctata]
MNSNMIRYSLWGNWRLFFRVGNQVKASSSSAPVATGLISTTCSESTEKTVEDPLKSISEMKTDITKAELPKTKPVTPPSSKSSSMVSAAFASLREMGPAPPKKVHSTKIDDRIKAAESVEELLSIAEIPQLSRRYALRIVSQLADWTTNGRAKLADFEADHRFLKLCRMMGRGLPNGVKGIEKEGSGFGDLAVVLGITGDDEAAKLVAGISMQQMVKIMSTLGQKQRRSTPLLRSLAFNLARQTDKLNIKECADLLYAMAVLNFPDELLLEKICGDLCECVASNQKPAVIGSVLTSLGLLKYKNTETLDILSDWVADHIDVCRPQDLTSLLLTLASVSHVPHNAESLFNVILPHISSKDVPHPAAWLDIVWSLVVLDKASSKHIASVLDSEFHNKLITNNGENNGISIASKLKLLNINAAAQLILPGYKGAVLSPDCDVRNVPLTRSRDKQLLVASIMDSFSNLLPSATYLQTNINTGMGFLLDGECKLDSKFNPLPVVEEVSKARTGDVEKKYISTTDTKQAVKLSRSAAKGIRIGIMALDYKDMCRGSPEPNGVITLSARLLEKTGYKILCIPYTEYNPREKLVQRVKYLDSRLKTLVKSS